MKQLHRWDPCAYRIAGEEAWREGEILQVTRTYKFLFYKIRDMQTGEVLRLIPPEDVRNHPSLQDN